MAQFNIRSFIILIYGDTGTGKSTLALTGEGRKAYMELDIGSLERAASGLPVSENDIDYFQYRLPPTSLRDRGRVSTAMVGQSGKGAATIVHKMAGWGDLAFKFRNEFCDFCESAEYSDIIIDTGNLAWELLQDGTREDIQKHLPPDQWEKELKRLEFEEPNKNLWEMCNYAKSCGKNLIFTSREGQVWSGGNYVEGSHKPEGSRDLPGYCDAIVRMTIVNKKPQAEIVKTAAGGMEISGMKLVAPTLTDLITLLRSAAAINRYNNEARRNGIDGLKWPSPLTLDSVIKLAEFASE